MKYALAFLVFFMGSIAGAQSQDTIPMMQRSLPSNNFSNKIGFAGSMFSGYGISYEYDVSRDFTLECTAAVFGEGGSTSNSMYDYTNPYLTVVVGAEVQKNFYRSSNSRFYGLIGIGYWLDNMTYSYDNSYRNKTDYTGGLGLGWEFMFIKRFVFNIEGGYVYRDMNTKTNNNGINYSVITNHNYYLGFGIGAGIYYAF